jgi:hypothetical protein
LFFDRDAYGGAIAGQINKVTSGDATPNAVDLVDILTQIATRGGRFSAEDLVFNGFPGNACAGFKELGQW